MTDHALLLLNLGSPASTEVADVRRYLNQFLMDPYVIDLPWPLRRLLVSLILLQPPGGRRPRPTASIWWEEGSPLVVLSRRLQQAKAPALAARPGGAGDALRRAVHRAASLQGLARAGRARGHPGAAVPAVRRQHRHHRDARKSGGWCASSGLALQFAELPPFYAQPEYVDGAGGERASPIWSRASTICC